MFIYISQSCVYLCVRYLQCWCRFFHIDSVSLPLDRVLHSVFHNKHEKTTTTKSLCNYFAHFLLWCTRFSLFTTLCLIKGYLKTKITLRCTTSNQASLFMCSFGINNNEMCCDKALWFCLVSFHKISFHISASIIFVSMITVIFAVVYIFYSAFG